MTPNVVSPSRIISKNLKCKEKFLQQTLDRDEDELDMEEVADGLENFYRPVTSTEKHRNALGLIHLETGFKKRGV